MLLDFLLLLEEDQFANRDFPTVAEVLVSHHFRLSVGEELEFTAGTIHDVNLISERQDGSFIDGVWWSCRVVDREVHSSIISEETDLGSYMIWKSTNNILQIGDDVSMTEVKTLTIQREVQLRFLSPEDIPEVKRLCADWFPIEYPDIWYQEITSNPKFYSLAATFQAKIIGLIVCEIKAKSKLNKEDSDILAPSFPCSAQVAYILSLGVVVEFRKHGIGSLLLDSLLCYLTSKERCNCKVAYLHVLSTNQTAIRFYERRNFSAHSYLPYYYSIQGKPRDGYSYVLYINGGKPPWSLLYPFRNFLALLIKFFTSFEVENTEFGPAVSDKWV
ncbi:hypothetical protein DPMN_027579 [Dreissena polymorpha]|uniref:N-alpha-acetyltransferase 60 n=1 Tax=Dreissena polymorpha TaxID=45954 RepID=A0A9D4LT84_DREPO|nr:hypothetical protein DPMN_027579 [Dreissena polymorpha]